jgi:hypothetical protein
MNLWAILVVVLVIIGAPAAVFSPFTPTYQGPKALIFPALGFVALSIAVILYTLFLPVSSDRPMIIFLMSLGVVVALSRLVAVRIILSTNRATEMPSEIDH